MKKTIFTYILVFFFCICFLLGAVSQFLYSEAFNADSYIKLMEKNGYDVAVLDRVYKQLEIMGDVITLSEDDIYPLLNEEELVNYSKNYAKSYLESIFEKKDFDSKKISSYSLESIKPQLKSLVEEFYQTSEESFSEEEFAIIYDYIEKQINSSLRFLSPTLLEKTVSMGKYISIAKSVFNITRFSFIASFVLLLGILLINLKEGIGRILYRIGTSVFIPSAILFIPTMLFDSYNLKDKINLARSPLSVLVSSVLDNIIKGFENFMIWFFVGSALLIIAGAFLKAFLPCKSTETIFDEEENSCEAKPEKNDDGSQQSE